MLGDFQYYSSSSEDSDSECDSDFSDKFDDCLEKLVSEKNSLEEKIQSFEKKLKYIQKTLKSLNEERKKLLTLRNNLVSSTFSEKNEKSFENSEFINNVTHIRNDAVVNNSTMEPDNLHTVTSTSIFEPLNLDVPNFTQSNDIEEEFDTDDDL
ncbi:hypothetical protein PGB90_002930 [Kerria lacca]